MEGSVSQLSDPILNNISIRNDITERKFEVYDKRIEDIKKTLQFCLESKGQLERFISPIVDKRSKLTRSTLENKNRIEIEIESTMSQLTDMFQQASLNKNNSVNITDLRNKSVERIINDTNVELLTRCRKIENSKIDFKIKTKSDHDELIRQLEEARKSHELVIKDIAKEQKHFEDLSNIIKRLSESNQELAEVNKNKFESESDEFKKSINEFKSLIESEDEKIKRLQASIEEKNNYFDDRTKEYDEAKQSKIFILKEIDENINRISLYKVSDNNISIETINKTALELSSKFEELYQEYSKAESDLKELNNNNENKSLSELRSELTTLIEERKLQNRRINESKEIGNLIKEYNADIQSKSEEIKNLELNLNERKLSFDKLKTMEKVAAKNLKRKSTESEIIRKLEEANKAPDYLNKNGINTDLLTPNNKKAKKSVENKSIERDREELTEVGTAAVVESPYPGIKIIQTHNKIKNPSPRYEDIDSKDSIDISFDSTGNKSLDGDTADGTMFGGLFSPLPQRDSFEEEGQEDKNEANVSADFSMLDHFKDFEKRHSQKSRKKNEDLTPSPQDSITNRFQQDIFMNSVDTEGIKSHSVSVSPRLTATGDLDNSKIDEDEEEEELSLDSSLVANDDDETDQTVLDDFF